MPQPGRLALALLVLWGTAARGEADLRRAKRERTVTVTGTPAGPLPEIRVSPDTLTLLWFPAQILKKTITVDPSRIRIRDAGESSIIVQAVDDYRADERQELEVFFADGKAPARAAFVLVMDAAEVDTRIDVKRPELPKAVCPVEEQRAAPLPEDFVRMGYVDARGVQTRGIDRVADNGHGLSAYPGVSYRGNGWVLFNIGIRNGAGLPPFSPRSATLTGKGGVALRVLRVTAARDTIAPGESVGVLVVADEPPASAGVVFALEVLGDTGRSLVIPSVTLPAAVAEGKR
ncbi:hypothetical protein DB31_7086 [Hyalangium minutum]|uniref:Myxococcus xanthus paralogous family TIGR02268 n=1 Tax=Hyalangium minutum TaxID=394096 RepID=A0A085WNC1_9BACT|nr:DUF2381 family protein [Hyalangium minutum]KFE69184.1 hypothetical protein DB31_7086 [Hyalangium minutum]